MTSGVNVGKEYEENLAELIGRLAAKGRDDPTIAGVLGITAAKVRRIRIAYKIPAGERRWLPAPSMPETCCDLHQPAGCCDPDDCGPCCENCPTCPTLAKMRLANRPPPERAFNLAAGRP